MPCFDAVTSERPYRRALSRDEAIRMIQGEAGKALDPAIVAEFTKLVPVLTPPTNDAFLRRTCRSNDPASHDLPADAGELLSADAFA